MERAIRALQVGGRRHDRARGQSRARGLHPEQRLAAGVAAGQMRLNPARFVRRRHAVGIKRKQRVNGVADIGFRLPGLGPKGPVHGIVLAFPHRKRLSPQSDKKRGKMFQEFPREFLTLSGILWVLWRIKSNHKNFWAAGRNLIRSGRIPEVWTARKNRLFRSFRPPTGCAWPLWS